MDGNRRWARKHGLPVPVGHASGARKVRSIVQDCSDRGVQYLTLFAFSTENWRRASLLLAEKLPWVATPTLAPRPFAGSKLQIGVLMLRR